MSQQPDSQALAVASAAAMLERDQATQSMGITLIEIGPGYARMHMTVRPAMLNGHQSCHGGYIFALADSAFAFACNSYNIVTVAASCAIDYLAPCFAGDVLQAEAVEQSRSGKTGIYDIAVTNQDGKKIALFRGKSHQLKEPVTAIG